MHFHYQYCTVLYYHTKMTISSKLVDQPIPIHCSFVLNKFLFQPITTQRLHTVVIVIQNNHYGCHFSEKKRCFLNSPVPPFIPPPHQTHTVTNTHTLSHTRCHTHTHTHTVMHTHTHTVMHTHTHTLSCTHPHTHRCTLT